MSSKKKEGGNGKIHRVYIVHSYGNVSNSVNSFRGRRRSTIIRKKLEDRLVELLVKLNDDKRSRQESLITAGKVGVCKLEPTS